MSQFFIDFSLSLCLIILAYVYLSKLLLVSVFCVLLACLYLKDDSAFFRYLATRVTSLYLCLCDYFSNLQNMYHQSNNTNIPSKKYTENNGTVLKQVDKFPLTRTTVDYRSNLISMTKPIYGLSPLLTRQDSPKSTTSWNVSPNNNPNNSLYTNKFHLFKSGMCGVKPTPEYNSSKKNKDSNLLSSYRSKGLDEHHFQDLYARSEETSLRSKNFISGTPTDGLQGVNDKGLSCLESSLRSDGSSALDAKLFANVKSPGFCSRVAERISEDMTQQPKYDTVGAFPVVHLRSQSPKTRIKTPVRVRLAPPTSDIVYTSTNTSSIPRSSLIGNDESMKSVLQVLKEISRKRIHSHVDEDYDDESSKRVRISESQLCNDSSVLQVSLLQQTIQGKRAREDSSPNEDVKKRRKPLQNNEISSSLSSSLSVKPPHLQSQKRKAHAMEDSTSSTPVLGKLLKVQSEVTPPSAPASPPVAVPLPKLVQEVKKSSPIPSPSTSSFDLQRSELPEESLSAKTSSPLSVPKEHLSAQVKNSENDDDEGTASRLLGRMSNQSTLAVPQEEIPSKQNVFMSTNDLSLSPPKENRLAAMIAVLGGPNESLEDLPSDNKCKQHEGTILKGKALFTSPGSPETPKQNKKVTFNDSLTTTKVYDTDKSGIELSNAVGESSNVSKLASPPKASNLVAGSTQFNFMSKNSGTANSADLKLGPCTSNNSLLQKENSDLNFSFLGSTALPKVSVQSSSSEFISPANTSNGLPSAATNSSFNLANNSTTSTAADSIKSSKFSFGSQLSSTESCTTQQLNLSQTSQILSPGSNTKTFQLTSSSQGSVNLPTNNKYENAISKEPDASLGGQEKSSFHFTTTKENSALNSLSNKNESEKKDVLNGFVTASTTSSPFAFNSSATPTSFKNADGAFSSYNMNPSSSQQNSNLFHFGSPSSLPAASTIQTPTVSAFSSSASSSTKTSPSQNQPFNGMSSTIQTTQSLNFFSNITSNTNQSKSSPFNSSVQVAPQSLGFGTSNPLINGFKGTETTQATPALFGNGVLNTSTTTKSGSDGTNTTHNSNLLGSFNSTSESKPKIFGAIGSTPSQQSSQVFGVSSTPPQFQASNSVSPFGNPQNQNTGATQTNNLFGSQTTTTQPTSMFGNVSTNNSQNSSPFISSVTSAQTSAFSSSVGNDTTKAPFQNSSSTTSTFGSTNPLFGNQNTSTFAFGGQTTTSSFAAQNKTTLTGFSSQGNNISTQSSFPSSSSFALNTNTSKSGENPSSSTPFVFGNSSASTEPAKPFAAAAPFSFTSQQSTQSVTSLQPSLPTYNASAAFGTGQQVPAFGGTQQPAAPAFAFGQTSTSTSTFQFSAGAAQPVSGGGMFTMGSGSTAPRSKATALRRRRP